MQRGVGARPVHAWAADKAGCTWAGHLRITDVFAIKSRVAGSAARWRRQTQLVLTVRKFLDVSARWTRLRRNGFLRAIVACDAKNASSHAEVRAVVTRWAVLTRSLERVRVVRARFARLLNNKPRLAKVTNRTRIAFVNRFNRRSGCFGPFLADVSSLTRTIIGADERGSEQVGQRVAFVSRDILVGYICGVCTHGCEFAEVATLAGDALRGRSHANI